MAKIYLHHYQKETVDTSNFERALRGKIKANFPDAYGIFGPETLGQHALIYRIPVFTGVNEVDIHQCDSEKGLVNLTVVSQDLLGGRVNRRLKQLLSKLDFTEQPQLLPLVEVSAQELAEHNLRQFHIRTADETVRDIVKSMAGSTVAARCIDEIKSTDLGNYLESRANALFEKENINAFASYSPKFKKLEVMRAL